MRSGTTTCTTPCTCWSPASATATTRTTRNSPFLRLGRALAEGFAYQGERSAFRGGGAARRAERPPAADRVRGLPRRSHDQVGNRAFGERIGALAAPEALRRRDCMRAARAIGAAALHGRGVRRQHAVSLFLRLRSRSRRGGSARATRGVRRASRASPTPSCAPAFPIRTTARHSSARGSHWSEAEQSPHREWLEFCRALLALRRQHVVPRLTGMSGGGTFECVPPGALAVHWTLGDGTRLHLAANLSAASADAVRLPGMVIYANGVAPALGSRPGRSSGRSNCPMRDTTARAPGGAPRHRARLLTTSGARHAPRDAARGARGDGRLAAIARGASAHAADARDVLPAAVVVRADRATACAFRRGAPRARGADVASRGRRAGAANCIAARLERRRASAIRPGTLPLRLPPPDDLAAAAKRSRRARSSSRRQRASPRRRWPMARASGAPRSSSTRCAPRATGASATSPTCARSSSAWGARGAGLVGVNPLHALFPHNPAHASPYSPSSRLFLNVLYLDVEAIADFARVRRGSRALVRSARVPGAAARRCARRRWSTIPASRRPSCAVLELLYAHFRAATSRTRHARARERSQRSARVSGEALRRHALFEALQEHFQRDGSGGLGLAGLARGVSRPGLRRGRAVRATSSATRVELLRVPAVAGGPAARARSRGAPRELGLGVGLYADLAVSVDRAGAESWANQALYALGASVGAPPDDFNPQGQDWGLPPLVPERLRAAAYAPFIATLRANMRHAGALRIDHVMGLLRLFWVPPGSTPARRRLRALSVRRPARHPRAREPSQPLPGDRRGPRHRPRRGARRRSPRTACCRTACCSSSATAPASSSRPTAYPPRRSSRRARTTCRRSRAGGQATTSRCRRAAWPDAGRSGARQAQVARAHDRAALAARAAREAPPRAAGRDPPRRS